MIFAAGATVTVVVLAAAIVGVLRPATLPQTPPEVAIANASVLREGVPAFVTVKELTGLASEARRLRSTEDLAPLGVPHLDELPVFVVKRGHDVRAFIGLDPRNGCRLETTTISFASNAPGRLVFHDVCHGSIYDLAGKRIGGPSPWDLDEIVASVRGGVVRADRRAVIPGAWAADGD